MEHRSPYSAEDKTAMAFVSVKEHRNCLNKIISVYDSALVRAYCHARFLIININILDILALCIRRKKQVLDIGCGFGLYGCYLASLYPEIRYTGFDLNPKRIALAQQAAKRLGLTNVEFRCQDARQLGGEGSYDAIMMVDILHHLDDTSKKALLERCNQLLRPGGHLVIKDVTTHPFYKIAFTWILDVVMTFGFEMWYWNEERFAQTLGPMFSQAETFPIADWLPYPHIVYLCEK
jgi:2-polyprenyl-3-methyl-5-hydroxy-6-metoxy-1,4-benzoquinol methylase